MRLNYHSRGVSMAFVGLLVVAAISMAAGSGRKPVIENSATSMRMLTTAEAAQVTQRFPELRTEGVCRIGNGLLERLFPSTDFYKVYSEALPPYPYLIAISGDDLLMMPDEFNRLLHVGSLKVTDKSIIELAKAFVLLAVGNKPTADRSRSWGHPGRLDTFPPVTFLESRRINQVIDGTPFKARLKVKIGGQVEDWYLRVIGYQFSYVSRRGAKGLIKHYLPNVVETLPTRGQLDQTPDMVIDTFPTGGDAYLEHGPQNSEHYYVIVQRNQDSTGNSVVFLLSDFPPNDTNVYVLVRDDIRDSTVWIDKVQMDSGSGSDTWTPEISSTGICIATAGHADDSNPSGTYVAITPEREITPERLIADSFPSASIRELLNVYFCDQFFKDCLPDSEAHADIFARYVDSAMVESWRTQANTWGLGTPPDTDHVHQVFINDATNWYHYGADPSPFALPGPNRKIGIPARFMYLWPQYPYSSESVMVASALAHEFYHGIQWGLSPAKVANTKWRWFTEGQARFIASAQYPEEEFDTTGGNIRVYADDADTLLAGYGTDPVPPTFPTPLLNVSLPVLSANPWRGYPYCLFWRFMYERFGQDSGGIQLVRDCFAENVDTSNCVTQGKAAIDSAIAKYWRSHPDSIVAPIQRLDDFLETLDDFAVACYLNDIPGQWFDPNHVYCRPFLTVDTTFKLGENETDNIAVDNAIDCSYGIDFEQLRLNGDVDTLLVTCATDVQDAAAGVVLWSRLVKVYPSGVFAIESTEVVRGGNVTPKVKFVTDGAERVCLVITRRDILDNHFGNDTVRFKVARAVAVSQLLPVTDTVPRGLFYTPRAKVANRGWMGEIFPATFKIGTMYSSTKTCTLAAGDSTNIQFDPW